MRSRSSGSRLEARLVFQGVRLPVEAGVAGVALPETASRERRGAEPVLSGRFII